MKKTILFLIAGFAIKATTTLASVLVIAGAGSQKANYEEYWENLEEEILFFNPNSQPLLADHSRDLKKLSKLSENLDSVLILAFSMGGKFAVELATLLPAKRVRALVLLDPIDGPPPSLKPSEKFPIWTNMGKLPKEIAERTYIFMSDPTNSRGVFGLEWTNQPFGPKRFEQTIPEAKSRCFLGTSHSSFLYPPLPLLTRLFCPAGLDEKEARIRADIKGLLESL